MAEALVVRRTETLADYARCVQIRTTVFVVGQSVPSEREVDDYEDECRHFLAICDGVPAGTGRWRLYGDKQAKLERLAVLDNLRGRGIGAALMRFMIADIQSDHKIGSILLGSQDTAIPFYETFGFVITGEGYVDGGTIPHHDMILKL